MRHQFTILLGPTDSLALGKTLTQVTRYAPLLEVKQCGSDQIVKTKSFGKIVRKQVTHEGKLEMQKLRDNGTKLKNIAHVTGYSEITIKRHTDDAEGRVKL